MDQGGNVPDFEVAIKSLSIDDFLTMVGRMPDGWTVTSLLAEFDQKGVPRGAVLRILQSQLDAGEVRLGKQMRLVRCEAEAA
jgi:hypothetical protein